jgi:hypothetical protein
MAGSGAGIQCMTAEISNVQYADYFYAWLWLARYSEWSVNPL